jgi:hypothetical protein
VKCLASIILVSSVFAAACAAPVPTSRPPESTSSPVPTLPPATAPVAPAFESLTYRDEVNGFELDYPSDWTIDSNVQSGSRGSQIQLFSPGTTAETLAEGGSRLSLTIYEWDPKHDLAAYIAQRRSAWAASGFKVMDGSVRQLVDGRPASDFFIEAPDGVLAYFLLTTNGDQYLQLAGEGNLQLLEAIGRTLRPLNYQN